MEDSSGNAFWSGRNGVSSWRFPVYRLARTLSKLVISAYFGDVQIIGLEKIPCEGPVIFVGNHNNKFVDAIFMVSCIPRAVYFLIASVSLKVPWIGTFAKALGAIGVERPQDSKFVGMGKLVHMTNGEALTSLLGDSESSDGLWLLTGNENTRFPLELKPGHKLKPIRAVRVVDVAEESMVPIAGDSFQVKEVVDDHRVIVKHEQSTDQFHVEKGLNRVEGMMVIDRSVETPPSSSRVYLRAKSAHVRSSSPCTERKVDGRVFSASASVDSVSIESSDPTGFVVYPKVDQGIVYDKVSQVLADGDCVCIFPEGGSHDRPDLLPLKPGVALFALQAYVSGVRDVLIVPVGLHYFERHKLGSRAVVEVGNPLVVSLEDGELFMKGGVQKTLAVNKMLERVRLGLQSVTVTAETYRSLVALQRCAEVYIPTRFNATGELQHRLQTTFGTLFSFNPLPHSLVEACNEYTRLLEERGFQDSEVVEMTRHSHRPHHPHSLEGEDTSTSTHLYLNLVSKTLLFSLSCLIAFPALLLFYPLSQIAFRKSLEAARQSSVKLAGVDVLASTKIELFLTTIPLILTLVSLLCSLATSYNTKQLLTLFPVYLTVTSVLIYYGLRLTQNIYTLKKQIQCYYAMCLAQISVTPHGTTDHIIASRARLQTHLRQHIKHTLHILNHQPTPQANSQLYQLFVKAKEATIILQSICPIELIEQDIQLSSPTYHVDYMNDCMLRDEII